MANTKNGNTFYIDAANGSSGGADLAINNVKVTHIILTATTAGGNIVLTDISTGATKFNLRQGTANNSWQFNFKDNPIVFPTGLRVTTLTNAVATVVFQVTGT